MAKSNTTNIYGRTVDLGGVFTSDKALVTFSYGSANGADSSDTDLAGMIVRTVNFSYMQPVNTIRSLTGTRIYYIVGTPMGRASFAGALSAADTLRSFFSQYGDACNINNALSITSNLGRCENSKNVSITIGNALATTFGGSVTSEDLMLMSQIELQFLKLSI